MTEQELIDNVMLVIVGKLEGKLHLIGNRLKDDAKAGAKEDRGGHPYIYDTHRFHDNLDYTVTVGPERLQLAVGSRAQYADFVLGGKVPSWTPLAPIKAWVERKALNWTDKKSGKPMTVDQMAFAIVGAIRQRGIPERNILQEVMINRDSWILQTLRGITA